MIRVYLIFAPWNVSIVWDLAYHNSWLYHTLVLVVVNKLVELQMRCGFIMKVVTTAAVPDPPTLWLRLTLSSWKWGQNTHSHTIGNKFSTLHSHRILFNALLLVHYIFLWKAKNNGSVLYHIKILWRQWFYFNLRSDAKQLIN